MRNLAHSETTTDHRFGRFAISNLFAQSAEQISLATTPIVAVYLLQATPGQTALLQLIQNAPFLLLAIPAGVLSDRLPGRAMLVATETLRASCFAIVLLLYFAGALDFVMLAALSFLGAAGTVAYNVTISGAIPLLVPRERLPIANSRLELIRSAAFTVGPALAGLVYSAIGGGYSYSLALILSLTAVALVSTIPLPRPASEHHRIVAELLEGFQFTFASSYLRSVLFTAVIFNTAWFILQAAFVPYAFSHYGMGATEVGTTLAVYGGGMMAGALMTPRLTRTLTFGSLIILGPLGGFTGGALMLASTFIQMKILIWAGFFFFGAGPVIWAAATATLRQAITSTALIGRVSAVIMTFTFGARPLGAFIAALLAARYDVSVCVFASFLGFGIQLLLIFRSAVRRLVGVPFPG